MVLGEVGRLRHTATNAELEAVLRETRIERTTREWWSSYPDLELPIRILAHHNIIQRYDAAITQIRRQNGATGGRPRNDHDRAVAKARQLMAKGQSLNQAAAAVGMSGPTLCRRLKR